MARRDLKAVVSIAGDRSRCKAHQAAYDAFDSIQGRQCGR